MPTSYLQNYTLPVQLRILDEMSMVRRPRESIEWYLHKVFEGLICDSLPNILLCSSSSYGHGFQDLQVETFSIRVEETSLHKWLSILRGLLILTQFIHALIQQVHISYGDNFLCHCNFDYVKWSQIKLRCAQLLTLGCLSKSNANTF